MVGCGSHSVLMVPDGPPGYWGARRGRTSTARQVRASSGTKLGRTARVAIPVMALRMGAIRPSRHGRETDQRRPAGRLRAAPRDFPT